jgi:hypothetical protein
MKYLISTKKLTLLLTLLILITTQNAFTQNSRKLSKLDQAIQTGFDSIKARKWSEAAKSYEDAQKIQNKEKQPSELLFTLFTLP